MNDTEIYLEHDKTPREDEGAEEPADKQEDGSMSSSTTDTDNAEVQDGIEETQSRLAKDSDETFTVKHEELEPDEIEEVEANDEGAVLSDAFNNKSAEYPLPTPEVGDMQPLPPPNPANREDERKTPS